MSVSLAKGGKVNLTKSSSDMGIGLHQVCVGLGWDVNTHGGADFDLDAWALGINESGAPNKQCLSYFGNKSPFGGAILHTGDNLTGAGEGDDEVIIIDFDRLENKVKYILVGVTIFRARRRNQYFKDVDNAFVRVYDKGTNTELCYYDDEFKREFANCTTIIFGAFVKNNNQWEFNAIGSGSEIESITDALTTYTNYVNTTNGGKKTMAVNLSKGGKVSLAKVAADAGIQGGLDEIIVGLGWDTNRYDGGAEFDLDASAFCCSAETGKVTEDADFVFYNNKVRPGVEHMGDNRTGEGDGDDEVINVKLSAIPANIGEVNFTVTIDQADTKHQNFGMVENSYIRIVDKATGTELIKYDLGEDFSVETAIVVAKLYRNNGEWKFNAIGSGFAGGLAALCNNFGVNV